MLKGLSYADFSKMMDSRQIVSTRIAADKLRYSLNHIYNLIESDKLSAYKYGKRVYITRESIEKYIRDNFDVYI